MPHYLIRLELKLYYTGKKGVPRLWPPRPPDAGLVQCNYLLCRIAEDLRLFNLSLG